MEKKNKIIIALVVVVILIVSISVFVLSSNMLNTVTISNIQQGNNGNYNETTNSGLYQYDVSFNVNGIDKNQVYTIKSIFYDSNNNEIASQTDKLDLNSLDDKGNANGITSTISLASAVNITNVTVEVLNSNGNVLATQNYTWDKNLETEFFSFTS